MISSNILPNILPKKIYITFERKIAQKKTLVISWDKWLLTGCYQQGPYPHSWWHHAQLLKLWLNSSCPAPGFWSQWCHAFAMTCIFISLSHHGLRVLVVIPAGEEKWSTCSPESGLCSLSWVTEIHGNSQKILSPRQFMQAGDMNHQFQVYSYHHFRARSHLYATVHDPHHRPHHHLNVNTKLPTKVASCYFSF
jgi:hypothetical protein